ncbi:MAG: radical SAM protein [Chloroflexi bacterium]|nr:MAG: radical SAM protein [Chloroflexota bacterium]
MNLLSRFNDLYLTMRPKPWKLEKPTTIQFPVNDICNSRCQMCNIWQKRLDYQISPEELSKILINPLFSEVRSVGVNGGEPTLRKDLSDLVDQLFVHLPKLSGISLITNAYQDKTVIERIIDVGNVVKRYNGSLDVMVSLDGFGQVHDIVRGKPGNFDRAVRVIDFIQNSKLVKSSRIGCTVIRDNVWGLHDLLEFALNKNIYIKYRVGIPHQRLYSDDVSEPFALTFEERYHFAIFLENLIKNYEESEQQKHFYKSLVGQLIYNNPRIAGCAWQHKGVTLSARGEILYCAVESKTLGSGIDQDANQLYFENKDHLADIVNNKCQSCMHDYVGLPSTRILLNQYAKSAARKIGFTKNVKLKQIPTYKTVSKFRRQHQFKKRQERFDSYLISNKNIDILTKSKNSEPQILICGWYGTETLGDKAIIGGVVSSIKEAIGPAKIHLASLEPYISKITVQQMPELSGCTVYSISDAIQLANTVDLVVFAGGPIMAIDAIAEMTTIFYGAERAGVPTLIAGCGVGPLGSEHHNRAIAKLLSLASHRIYRDQRSLDLAQTLGIDTVNDEVAEDPAFAWLCKQESFAKDSNNNSDPRLLLGLRDWTFHEYANDLDPKNAHQIKTRFEREVIISLLQLIEIYPQLKIYPFPMCTNHIGQDDRWFYRRFFRNVDNKLAEALDMRYLGRELSPLESINAFNSATAVLTMRYHSLVFSLAMGKPCVSIDYTLGQGKVNSLAKKYEVPNMRLDTVTSESLVAKISSCLVGKQNRNQISKDEIIFDKVIHSFLTQ